MEIFDSSAAAVLSFVGGHSRGQCAGSEAELIAVGFSGQRFHCEKWSLGTATRRTHAAGATPLKNCHQRKMKPVSNTIKSNASHSVECVNTDIFTER